MIPVLSTPHAMQAWSDGARAAGQRLALVPTMGALHAGHAALVREARRHAERVVVSIFVNPLQFNRRDDFEHYPRTLDEDVQLAEQHGADAIYAPNAAAMYPEGFQSSVEVGNLTAPLCGAGRPGHFKGVTTVVTKLFLAVRPHVAVFGEKDFQQLAVIRRLTADLDFGVEIVGVPTVREADGVALSSRNRLLAAEDRVAARCLSQALTRAAETMAAGETRAVAIVNHTRAVLASEPRARVEYAELRDPTTLEPVEEVRSPALLALAVWVGGVRLIDNRVLAPKGYQP